MLKTPPFAPVKLDVCEPPVSVKSGVGEGEGLGVGVGVGEGCGVGVCDELVL